MNRIQTILLLVLIIIAIGIVAVATRTPGAPGSDGAAADGPRSTDTTSAVLDSVGAGSRDEID